MDLIKLKLMAPGQLIEILYLKRGDTVEYIYNNDFLEFYIKENGVFRVLLKEDKIYKDCTLFYKKVKKIEEIRCKECGHCLGKKIVDLRIKEKI